MLPITFYNQIKADGPIIGNDAQVKMFVSVLQHTFLQGQRDNRARSKD